jgi:hypothetical protein
MASNSEIRQLFANRCRKPTFVERRDTAAFVSEHDDTKRWSGSRIHREAPQLPGIQLEFYDQPSVKQGPDRDDQEETEDEPFVSAEPPLVVTLSRHGLIVPMNA